MLEAYGQADLDTLDFEFVDVVCIGSGSAGLAAAVVAADAGQSVIVAEPRRRTSQTGSPADTETWLSEVKRRWGAEEFDETTADYLLELTRDLDPPRRSHAHGELPAGSVESFVEARLDPRRPVPPFYGHEIAGWARDCMTSPYGLMFSRLTPMSMPELRIHDGTTIRAGVIAHVPPSRRAGMTLRQWLRDLAMQRGVRIYRSSVIQRLIFVDGEPVGAVLETADGVHHVWARKGVLMGTSNSAADDLLAPAVALRDGRLSLVSRNASRFARLELLTSVQSMTACALPLQPHGQDDLSGTLVG